MSDPVRQPHVLLWLDFETTGLDPKTLEVLEVAAVVTDLNLDVLGSFAQIIRPDTIDLLSLNPIVREMHTKNGLLDAVVNASYGYASSVDHADACIASLLRNKLEVKPGNVRLAGAGVSHFDHGIILRDWPATEHFLHYATLDVSIIKRFLVDVVGDKSLLAPEPEDKDCHRAMPDVVNAIREARHYKSVMRMWGVTQEGIVRGH